MGVGLNLSPETCSALSTAASGFQRPYSPFIRIVRFAPEFPQLEATNPIRGRESPVRVTHHNLDAAADKPTNVEKSPKSIFLRAMLHKGHERQAEWPLWSRRDDPTAPIKL